jgi:uncharacterized protein
VEVKKMKIGIMADSHENMDMIARAVNVFNEKNVSYILHAGDIISPITFKEFKNLKMPMYMVFGNNDGEKVFLKEKFKDIATVFDRYGVIELAGKKILLYHIPDFINSLVKSGDYDIIVYGHTHIIDIRKEYDTLIINPGETGVWLEGKSTVCILDLDTLQTEIINLIN